MGGDFFEREIRFAVVMYGGVSLAIYMNGIAQELLRMVRATAPAGDPTDGKFRWQENDPALDGTERIYRRLGGELKARFVVDIISGTSAGGINGIFLAKALAHNRPLDNLRALWVQEGDVAKLLNDGGVVRGGVPDELSEDPPTSLLSGNRFYWELLDAMEEMDLAPPARDLAGSKRAPYVDEIDLYVTATDFQGANLPLVLFDKTIEEPVHRKLFHFRYWKKAEADPDTDDLARGFNPMLAFAARCTASFPAAFSPFKLEDIDAALENHPSYAKRAKQFGSSSPDWKRFFAEYSEGYAKRYFVDGGYLDNKPFEAAVGALSSRQHILLPVERKLLYIEPDPERHGRDKEIPRPDVVSALTAVVSLPRVETIRAEVNEITRRNYIYGRASILTAAVEEDARKVSKGTRQRSGPAGDWARKDLQDLIVEHGLAYGGYHRLKVSGIIDWLARCLFGAVVAPDGGPTIDEVHKWVSAWRDKKYKIYYEGDERARRDAGTQQPPLPLIETRLLIDLDVAYRLRRLEFVRIKLRDLLFSAEGATEVLKLAGKIDPKAKQIDEAEWRQARKPLIEIQRRLESIHQDLILLDRKCLGLTISPPLASPPIAATPIAQAIVRFKADRDGAAAEELLNALADTVAAHLTAIGDEWKKVLAPGSPPSGDLVELARAALAHLYAHFDDFDLVGFPLLYCLGTRELAKVDVLRVSAADTNLAKEGAAKLAGVRLGHFGAFLDPRWRENDILWGRLDGAERIIAAVAAEKGKAYIDAEQDKAFVCILADRRQELSPVPAAAALPQAAAPPREAIAAEARRLTADPDLPAETTLGLLGRSTAVVRKLIGGVAGQRGAEKSVVIAWALRLLLVVWGIVEAAVPRSLIQLLVRYWLNLVMLSGGLLVGVGFLLDRSGEKWIGGALFAGAALLRGVIQAITSAAARRTKRANPLRLLGLFATGVAGAVLTLPLARATVGAFDGIDFQLAHDHERLAEIFAGCSVDCVGDISRAIGFDFGLLVSYALALSTGALLVRAALMRLGSHAAASVAKKLATAAVAAALADALENAGMLTTIWKELWRPLDNLPGDTDRFLAHLVPALTYASSLAKWTLVGAVIVLIPLTFIFGSGAALLRWWRNPDRKKQPAAVAAQRAGAGPTAAPPGAPAPPTAGAI